MNQHLLLPGPLAVRLTLWLALLFCFPLPGSVVAYSFRVEVLGQVEPGQVVFPATAEGAASIEEPSVDFSDRTLVRLVEAEARETDAWFRDDYRIARVTVGLARKGSPIPHIEATYRVLGVHPDQVWPRIMARRHAILGADYEAFFGGQSSPKKPVGSVRLEDFERRKNAA
jgi:hypothetical protein